MIGFVPDMRQIELQDVGFYYLNSFEYQINPPSKETLMLISITFISVYCLKNDLQVYNLNSLKVIY